MSEATSEHRPVDPVEVAESRRRIPVWAVVLFPVLLVWGIIYVNAVSEPPVAEDTPAAVGARIYGKSCGGCHGVNGEGISGPALAGGDLAEVFPEWSDQVQWVDVGAQNWLDVTGKDTFGATDKIVGGGMPGFGPAGNDGSLSCDEIAMVVAYTRTELAGIEPAEDMTELTEQIASGQQVEDIPGCEA